MNTNLDLDVSGKPLPVSVLIMTQNEEANIAQALSSVASLFEQVVVVDSFSVDKTQEIVKSYPTVELYTNRFIDWATQRMWIIENCGIRNEIVFFLDADEFVRKEFAIELAEILDKQPWFEAIEVKPEYIFLNSRLRFAYGHPRIRRIFKRTAVKFRGEGAREYSERPTQCVRMKTTFIHNDRKPLSQWFQKHIRNAFREAELVEGQRSRATRGAGSEINAGAGIRAKRFVREHVWGRLPLLIRPWLYFVYRFIIQFGFLDGLAGLTYCAMHAFWYQMIIDIIIIDRRIRAVRGD